MHSASSGTPSIPSHARSFATPHSVWQVQSVRLINSTDEGGRVQVVVQMQNPNDVHFNAAGYEFLGKRVAEAITEALK